jgi:glycosyltransferase involved in cell wall biosynthesis
MISFIIPAHNEELWIGRSVSAIRTAADAVGEPYEIIVVDDASDDATGSIAAGQGARVIRVEHRHIAATRNAGARAAQGEVFFFVDADTLANADAVRGGLEALRGGAVGGGCIFRFDGLLPLWARILYPVGANLGRLFKVVGGCFLFCRREAFDNVGGFCERYYAAEEIAFIRALKRQGRFVVPRPCVTTSGRKLGALSVWKSLRLLARIALHGPESFRERKGLELWYGPRQDDPRYDRLTRRPS